MLVCPKMGKERAAWDESENDGSLQMGAEDPEPVSEEEVIDYWQKYFRLEQPSWTEDRVKEEVEFVMRIPGFKEHGEDAVRLYKELQNEHPDWEDLDDWFWS
jgi:hypothetical protein